MSAVVQTKEAGAFEYPNPFSISITTDSPVTAGNMLIVVASGYGVSVSDGVNQYSQAASVLSVGSPQTAIFRTIAKTSAVLTVTMNSTWGGIALHFYEISGGYNALDVFGSDALESARNPFSISTSGSTNHANELVVLAQRVYWGQAGTTQTVTTPAVVEATLDSQEFVLDDGDIVTSAVWEVSSTGVQTGVITTTNQIPFSGTAQGLLIATFYNAGTLYSIAGNAGVAGATVSYTSLLSGSGTVTADGSGNFTFLNLAPDTYTITPTKATYTFTPTSTSRTITNANVTGVNFAAHTGSAIGWSPVDSRVTPNTGIVQSDGSVFYTGQTSSNPSIPPTDSRKAGAPVDSRDSKPTNSRTAPPFAD